MINNKTKKNKNSKKNNKPNKKNQTKKNNVKKCMETFVENKIKKLRFDDIDKKIQKLDKKNLTDVEKKQQSELKRAKKLGKKTFRKMYKLYNCNMNCKDTILEPGPPNKIPKSMHKGLLNDKKLIEDFNNDRKKIFKDKKNVLVDDFYENTADNVKEKLVKEGAISQCLPVRDVFSSFELLYSR